MVLCVIFLGTIASRKKKKNVHSTTAGCNLRIIQFGLVFQNLLNVMCIATHFSNINTELYLVK